MTRKGKPNKRKISISLRSLYRELPLELRKKVTEQQYSSFLYSYYEEVKKLLLYENFRYKFIGHVGTFFVVKYKPYYMKTPLVDGQVNMAGRKINWIETNKLWTKKPELKGTKFVYHSATSKTEFYDFRLYWTRNLHHLGHSSRFYAFSPCRTFKIDLAKAILEDRMDYEYMTERS